MAKKLAGKIILQVQGNGEACYINPADNKKYFLARPGDAFNIMRQNFTVNFLSEIALALGSELKIILR